MYQLKSHLFWWESK